MSATRSAVGVRAADADRDACIELLQEHFVAGRLDSGELDDRVGQALRARTQTELDDLLADCRPQPASRRPVPRRVGRYWVVAAVAAAVVGGFGAFGLSAQSSEPVAGTEVAWLTTCDTTGVDLPDGVECPEMTVEQEQLNEDADRAIAAVDQLHEMAAAPDTAELQALLADATKAKELASSAKADAQLIVAKSRDGRIGKAALKKPAQQARDAASAASRAVIMANRALNR